VGSQKEKESGDQKQTNLSGLRERGAHFDDCYKKNSGKTEGDMGLMQASIDSSVPPVTGSDPQDLDPRDFKKGMWRISQSTVDIRIETYRQGLE